MSEICPQCGSDNINKDGLCLDCESPEVNWLSPGTTLDGRYQILEAIKAGGMGAIYKGYDQRLDQICAVKEMLSDEESDLDYMLKRFLEEAKLLADLRHSGIPRVTDYFCEHGRYYLIMDYLNGVDILTYIESLDEKTLDEDFVIELSVQICDILNYIHNQKPEPIIHRDLKPANIFLCEDNKVMLIDFGIARPINLKTHSEKTIVGTLGYAPLEQFQGHPEPRSDLYALGGVMYFMLTGVQPAPFKLIPLKELRADISDLLDMVIKKSLSLSPENRFSSAIEMKEVLERKREIGVYTDDSKEKESIRKHINVDSPKITTKKGFLSQKSGKHIQEAFSSASKDVSPQIDRIIDMAEKGDIRALEPLLELLRSNKYNEKRRKIIILLCNFKDQRVIEPLISALSDTDEYVRRYVPGVLGKMQVKKAFPEILKLIEDPSEPVRKSALNAIGELSNNHNLILLEPLLSINKEDYINKFPDDSSLYFDTLKELLLNIFEGKESIKVFIHQAVLYEIVENYFIAEENIKKAIQIRRDFNTLFIYGRIMEGMKKYEKAIEIYSEAYKLNQGISISECLSKTYYKYGKHLEELGKTRDAVICYNRAYKINLGEREKKFFENLLAYKGRKSKKTVKLQEFISGVPEGFWRNEAIKLVEEINKAPFPGVVHWFQDLLDN